ncbi:MAG: PLP-dependent aminotransferase family protein [Clostridia bacterium]|nr:PLP-dependent aminotransferase family protein [Clostridia bacterium]
MTMFAKRMEHVTGSAIRELFKLLGDPEIISFGGGNPAKESFPVDTVRALCDELLAREGSVLLQYGATEGYGRYLDAYIGYLAQEKGICAQRSNVLATTGSMQGIDLICKAFLDPGDAVLVESPAFLGALQTFNLSQAKLVPVPMDAEGVMTDALEELMREWRPKLFYCIPTFQNPTGKTLGVERRKRVAELAAKYDVIVAEDDPYCELRYRGEALPPIKAFDESDHVILLNSFSKTLSPGLRVGAAMGSAPIIRKLTICKQSADTHTANITQAIAAEFMLQGLMKPHLESIRPMYLERMNAMLDAAHRYFPRECALTNPDGGLFIWGEMPEGTDMLALFNRAVKERGVAFIPGEHFYCREELGKHTLRLNFSSEPVERIARGMEALGGLLAECL